MRITREEVGKKLGLARFIFGQSFEGKVETVTRTVLDHVNLDVEEGEIMGLLGPNGAGKSTLLEILAGGILPDEGSAEIMGYDVETQTGKATSMITPIFPMFGAESMWTARQNLEFVALLYNIRGPQMKNRIKQVLQIVGLVERADEVVRRYSTGMRVRLTLATGFLIDNPVYLMDEPMVGIDPKTARDLRTLLKTERQGRTILLATHQLPDAEQLCDRLAIISQGRIVSIGDAESLRRNMKGKETVTLEASPRDGTEEFEGHLRETIQNAGWKESALDEKPENPGVFSIRILTRDSGTVIPDLVDAVLSLGGRILRFSVQEPSLEDVFIHYVGEGGAR